MAPVSLSAEDMLGLVVSVDRDGDTIIGSGGFAQVWKGRIQSGGERSTIVAVKEPKCFSGLNHQSSERSQVLRVVAKRLIAEVSTWKKLQYRYILPFLGICFWNSNHLNLPSLVSPWMRNGTSREYLPKHPEANPIQFLLKTAEGLEYLHQETCSHGDIKGANVLVSDDGSPLLGDFGLSKFIRDMDSDPNTRSSALTYTCSWRWADIQHFQRSSERRMNRFAADIWAFGRLVLELWTNRNPFCDVPTHDEERIRNLVLENTVPLFATCYNPTYRKLNYDIENLCYDCWKLEPTERPSIAKIITFLREKLVGQEEGGEEPRDNNSVPHPLVGLFDFLTLDDRMPTPFIAIPSLHGSQTDHGGPQTSPSLLREGFTLDTNRDSSNRSASFHQIDTSRTNLLESNGRSFNTIQSAPSSNARSGGLIPSVPLSPPPPSSSSHNYLSQFNEYLAKTRLDKQTEWVPIYEIAEPGNPARWRMDLKICGLICGTGIGPTKQEAKHRAAEFGGRVLGNADVRCVLDIQDPITFERDSHIVSDYVETVKSHHL